MTEDSNYNPDLKHLSSMLAIPVITQGKLKAIVRFCFKLNVSQIGLAYDIVHDAVSFEPWANPSIGSGGLFDKFGVSTICADHGISRLSSRKTGESGLKILNVIFDGIVNGSLRILIKNLSKGIRR